MQAEPVNPELIRAAWQGRVSGCMLGKPIEVLSYQQGRSGIESYLKEAGAWPLRDYIPLLAGTVVERHGRSSCRGQMVRSAPDDDINYTYLALNHLEAKGAKFCTEDVARAWLSVVPAGATWTAERAAYRTLLQNMNDEFVNGDAPGFDLDRCADNPFNDWIGAQIRADLYGWVCPGRPALAADLARRDAALSHRGEGVHGAAFIAALGAAIPVSTDLNAGIAVALAEIPSDSAAASAVRLGLELANSDHAVDHLHDKYQGLSPVHVLNNLALVIWALCSAEDDFSAAVGQVVMAGWDTDSNGATVGGLFGLTGATIPDSWTRPWAGRIGLDIAGVAELQLDDAVTRTVAVARELEFAPTPVLTSIGSLH